MVDAKGFLQAELADDGLHPNSAGYRVMAPVALAAIDKARRFFEQRQAPQVAPCQPGGGPSTPR